MEILPSDFTAFNSKVKTFEFLKEMWNLLKDHFAGFLFWTETPIVDMNRVY